MLYNVQDARFPSNSIPISTQKLSKGSNVYHWGTLWTFKVQKMLPFGVKYKQFKSVMDILLSIPFLKSDTYLEGHEI